MMIRHRRSRVNGFEGILARLLLLVALAGAALSIATAWAPAPAATLLPNGEQTFVDGNGIPISGGSVGFYIPNTSTPKTTWSNPTQTTANTNPVVLDSAGRAIIYGSGTYRQIVRDALGNLVWDQLTADTSSTGQSFAGTSTGGANAQVLTGGTFSQTNGQVVTFIAGLTNTAATNLTINGFGPINVDKDLASGPSPLTGGEIVAGNQVTVVYDATLGVLHMVSLPPAANLVVTGMTTLGGSVAFTGTISPTALAVNTDNWNPTGLAGASVIRASASTPVQVTGLTAQRAGTILSFQNVGNFAIQLLADSASSLAANQFDLSRTENVQPGESVLLQYDGTSIGWRLFGATPAQTLPAGLKRQTVSSGPTDPSSGMPNYVPATSVSRSLTTTGITVTSPLTVTAAFGFNLSGSVDMMCQSTGNLTWASLTANLLSYLFVTVNADGTCTTGSTTTAPIYLLSGTAISTTNGQYTFDTVHYQMWLGNGSTATEVAVVFVGEATTSASAVTAAIAYAYSGRWDSGYINTTPGIGTTTTLQSNLGVEGVVALSVKNLTTQANYSVGDIATNLWVASASAATEQPTVGQTRNSAWFTTGSTIALGVLDKSAGTAASLVAADWAYHLTHTRTW